MVPLGLYIFRIFFSLSDENENAAEDFSYGMSSTGTLLCSVLKVNESLSVYIIQPFT
jgi:hypothetical protein